MLPDKQKKKNANVFFIIFFPLLVIQMCLNVVQQLSAYRGFCVRRMKSYCNPCVKHAHGK